MKKNLLIIVVIISLLCIVLIGCIEEREINYYNEDNSYNPNELTPYVFRIDFKPDTLDSYTTNQTWDDFSVINETELIEYQKKSLESNYTEIANYPEDTDEHRNYKLNESRAFNIAKSGLLNETRKIDCNDSFLAIKEIFDTVRNYAVIIYENQDIEENFLWLKEWNCFRHQYAMLYALSDAQLRNIDIGNWSDINIYPISNIILSDTKNDSHHASFITSFPGKDGKMIPYVTDTAYCGWKKYVNDSEDDTLWPWEEYLTGYDVSYLGSVSQTNFICPMVKPYCIIDFAATYFTILIDGKPKDTYDFNELIEIHREQPPEEFLNFIYFPSEKVNDIRCKILSVYNQVEGDTYNYRLIISSEDGGLNYYLWNR